MNDTIALHDTGHSLGLWLFSETTPWFEFVLHTVLLAAPFALFVLLGTWLLWFHRRFKTRRQSGLVESPMSSAPAAVSTGIYAYVLKHTRRSQAFLLVIAAIAMPLLYAGLELPKLIINNAISSGHFPVEVAGTPLSQTGYLFLLSSLYLAVIMLNGSFKYAINVHKGRVAEALLRRLRLTIYRYWRRSHGQGDRAEVIPLLVQEVEPIGGFAGNAFVLPLFQGGTFLTILAFMFVQDAVLGAAAITLLPVQLAVIPRLQRKINELARRRSREMRGLGGAIGREVSADPTELGETRRHVASIVRRIAEVRFEIYRKKFLMKALNNFITQLTPFFFYTIGGYLVIDGRLSFGALVAVLAAHKDFSAPLKELLKYYQAMEDVRVRFAETQQFLTSLSSGSPPNREPEETRSLAAASSTTRCQPSGNEGWLPDKASALATIPSQGSLEPCASKTYSS